MNVVYGWKRRIPMLGIDIISMFADEKSKDTVVLDEINSIENEIGVDQLEQICKSLEDFMINKASEDTIVAFIDKDPLDILDEVEFILSDLDEYNTVNMIHSIYFETFGNDPQKFSTLLSYSPDYIVVKIAVPKSEQSDHKSVENAIECLRRSIDYPHTNDCEKILIVLIRDDSDISVLKKYFEVITEAFGDKDKRVEWAEGAALYSFDILIRPETKDLAKVLEAQTVLQDPDLNLSQNIRIDTSLIDL